jgi:hypothetical protein
MSDEYGVVPSERGMGNTRTLCAGAAGRAISDGGACEPASCRGRRGTGAFLIAPVPGVVCTRFSERQGSSPCDRVIDLR